MNGRNQKNKIKVDQKLKPRLLKKLKKFIMKKKDNKTWTTEVEVVEDTVVVAVAVETETDTTTVIITEITGITKATVVAMIEEIPKEEENPTVIETITKDKSIKLRIPIKVEIHTTKLINITTIKVQEMIIEIKKEESSTTNVITTKKSYQLKMTL
jgi:hypothetical protein